MSGRGPFGIRMRWVLPGGALVVAGAVLAGTVLASAAAPDLPRRTPAELIAAVRQAKPPATMIATVSESANLGFPALPDIGGPASSPLSAASLLAGTHTIQIWYGGPGQVRIARPVSFGETDLRINGTHVWLWDSQGQRATRVVPPAPSHGPGCMLGRAEAAQTPPPGCRLFPRRPHEAPGGRHNDPFAGLTPLAAAERLLAMAGPTTRVTVPGTTVVAGRDAYQLAIAPRSGQSLIGRIMIAVDATTHLPLSVQVFARGAASPALAIGFTALSFARPAAANFTFTPPPGAKVKTVHLPGPPGLGPGSGGLPGAPRFLPGAGQMPHEPGTFPHDGALMPHGVGSLGPRTFGTGWLTVIAIPIGQSEIIRAPAGPGQGLLGALAKAATPVHGSWGSGRLLRTTLVSVLLTSKGELLAGAVTPAVLYADAAKVQ